MFYRSKYFTEPRLFVSSSVLSLRRSNNG